MRWTFGLYEKQRAARGPRIASLIMAGLIGGIALTAVAQVVAVGEISLSGIVETVTREGLTIRDSDGTRHQVRVQGKDRRGVALTDGTLLAAPVEATVRAEFPAAGLKPGQIVRLRSRLDRSGKAQADLMAMTVLDGDTHELGVTEPGGEPEAAVPKGGVEVENAAAATMA